MVSTRPDWWRVTAGLALAPAVASFTFSMIIWLFIGARDFGLLLGLYLLLVVIFGYAPLLFVGLPLMLILTRWFRLTALNCSLSGATVAVLPLLVLFMSGLRAEPLTDARTTFAQRLVIVGSSVDKSIPELGTKLEIIGIIALYGTLVGVIFWIFAEFDTQSRRLSSDITPMKTR